MQTGTIQIDHESPFQGKATITIRVENQKVHHVDVDASSNLRFFETAAIGQNVTDFLRLVNRIDSSQHVFHHLAAVKAIEAANQISVLPSDEEERNQALELAIGVHHVQRLSVQKIPRLLKVSHLLEAEGSNKFFRENLLRIQKVFSEASLDLIGPKLEPVHLVVGGYFRNNQVDSVKRRRMFESIRPLALELVQRLDMHHLEDHSVNHYLAHVNPNYSFGSGWVESIDAKRIKSEDYYSFFKKMDHQTFLTLGSRARLALNKNQLHYQTYNDCKSIIRKEISSTTACAVELLHVIDRLIDRTNLVEKQEWVEQPVITSGVGSHCIESATGVLAYSVEIDHYKRIQKVEIVTPLEQEWKSIRQDIRLLAQENIHQSKLEIGEKVRSYLDERDPHWLELLHEDNSFRRR